MYVVKQKKNPELYASYYSLLVLPIITREFDKVLQTEIFLCTMSAITFFIES